MQIEILFEDNDYLVLNKPAGLVVPPTIPSVTGLPARIEGLEVQGTGRIRIRAVVDLADGRTIRGELRANVVREGI
ncbi:hypothetical protein IIA15_06085, partial [candidate division TA06 bacterium]|nr:hypothetical protein [candidate division TA06 bacterium]